MRLSDARTLLPGDKVYWNDPDGGACSRSLIISTIEIKKEDGSFKITDDDGGFLEGYLRELEC